MGASNVTNRINPNSTGRTRLPFAPYVFLQAKWTSALGRKGRGGGINAWNMMTTKKFTST